MAQKLNKKQGNDQIIADFFKKSIWFVLIITMIIAIVYFYQSRENTLEIVEKEYQPPEKLKIEISPPEILFSEEAEKEGLTLSNKMEQPEKGYCLKRWDQEWLLLILIMITMKI